ncbi:ComF family protein [Enterococcus sp. DIV0660C]|uniref:ComF family protein n=1 Tax=Enterococcus sp. DIV0660C TaxID=2230880 RepID=UPI001A8ED813|nr:ComF family protein [Enterococcus sp. DIV0660C]MBO0430691.1 ComF family protein [Enterococcus sp. DIV0660C]
MKCCYCQKPIIKNLTIKELVQRKKSVELCWECAKLFTPLSSENKCDGCQKSLLKSERKSTHSQKRLCTDCLYWQERYPTYDFCHRSFFKYDEAMQTWFQQYKFTGDIRLAGTFAKQWQSLPKRFPDYLFCPIPLSNERLAQRGFNQVSQMLKVSGVTFQILLKRVKHHSAQAQHTRVKRLAMPQPFALCVEPEQIKQCKILLIDDVYTTGQTLFHAATCLAEYQPIEVRTFSLAR